MHPAISKLTVTVVWVILIIDLVLKMFYLGPILDFKSDTFDINDLLSINT